LQFRVGDVARVKELLDPLINTVALWLGAELSRFSFFRSIYRGNLLGLICVVTTKLTIIVILIIISIIVLIFADASWDLMQAQRKADRASGTPNFPPLKPCLSVVVVQP
jgi:uncharacterized membrane protein